MKKKILTKVLQRKKYVGLATGEYDDFTLIFIIFLVLLQYFAIFIRHTE